jgi:hypothetical protein
MAASRYAVGHETVGPFLVLAPAAHDQCMNRENAGGNRDFKAAARTRLRIHRQLTIELLDVSGYCIQSYAPP